jgi:hypothetical protein
MVSPCSHAALHAISPALENPLHSGREVLAEPMLLERLAYHPQAPCMWALARD